MKIIIVEHEDGRTMYFGPAEGPELQKALNAAEEIFGYKNTPFTVSATTLSEPSAESMAKFRELDAP